MSIIISAVEVGSVRALVPVCYELMSLGKSIIIDDRGFFSNSELAKLKPFLITFPDNHLDIISFLKKNNVKSLLFSVNIHDPYPLFLARIADSIGIKTVHVLDYWNGYASRMKLDGNSLFLPTMYIVPDQYAATKAISEGINERCISIMGQPAMADAEESYIASKKQVKNPIKGLFNEKYKIILFISEPVSNDQGNSLEENENYRGYVEKDALKILIDAVAKTKSIRVLVLPHPRQSVSNLKSIWRSLGGEKYGQVLDGIRGRDLFPFIVGVSGMASTLLYEAFLIGLPVVSIQPGLLNDLSRMLENKKNVVFIDRYNFADKTVFNWLQNLKKGHEIDLRPELKIHKNASHQIAQEVIVND